MSPDNNVSTGLLKSDDVVLNGIVSKLVRDGPTLTPTVSNNLNITFEILFILPCDVPSPTAAPPSILIVWRTEL